MFTSPSNKKYIGICAENESKRYTVFRRWQAHARDSSNCRLLLRAIKKYGFDNMKKRLLYCSVEYLKEYEQKFIDLYDSLAPNGYNCTTGGEGGKHLCNETHSISKGLKAYYTTHDNPNKGKTVHYPGANITKQTNESKNKISESLKKHYSKG